MKHTTLLIPGVLLLLLCSAVVQPVPAMDLNPFSYILRQPDPVPSPANMTLTPTVPARGEVPAIQETLRAVKTQSGASSFRTPQVPQATTGQEGTAEIEYTGRTDSIYCQGPPNVKFCSSEVYLLDWKTQKTSDAGIVEIVAEDPEMIDALHACYLKGTVCRFFGPVYQGQSTYWTKRGFTTGAPLYLQKIIETSFTG